MNIYEKVELLSDFCAEYDLEMSWDYEKDQFKVTDGWYSIYLTVSEIENKKLDAIERRILNAFDIYG